MNSLTCFSWFSPIAWGFNPWRWWRSVGVWGLTVAIGAAIEIYGEPEIPDKARSTWVAATASGPSIAI